VPSKARRFRLRPRCGTGAPRSVSETFGT